MHRHIGLQRDGPKLVSLHRGTPRGFKSNHLELIRNVVETSVINVSRHGSVMLQNAGTITRTSIQNQ